MLASDFRMGGLEALLSSDSEKHVQMNGSRLTSYLPIREEVAGQKRAKVSGRKVGDGEQKSEIVGNRPTIHRSSAMKAREARTRAKAKAPKTTRATKSVEAKSETSGKERTRNAHAFEDPWQDPWADWSKANAEKDQNLMEHTA